jgi:hypothetical protein
MATVSARNLRVDLLSSIVFANHTVQVTTDANASPSITACTNTSADKNIDQADRSRGRFAVIRGGSSEVASGGSRLAPVDGASA